IADQDTGQGEPTPRGPASPRQENALIDRLATAADAALERALERAGNRLLSKMNGSRAGLKERVQGIPVEHVMANLSNTEIHSLGLSQRDLFRGAWDSLATRARAWVQDHFIQEGHDPFDAEQKAKAVVMTMVAL